MNTTLVFNLSHRHNIFAVNLQIQNRICLFVVQLGSVIRDYPLPYILKGNYVRHIGGGLFPIRDIYLLLAIHDVRKCQIAIFTLQNTNAHFSYKNHEPCHQWQCCTLYCQCDHSTTLYSAVHHISCLGVSPSLHRPGVGADHLSWPGPGDSYPGTTEGHPAPV